MHRSLVNVLTNAKYTELRRILGEWRRLCVSVAHARIFLTGSSLARYYRTADERQPFTITGYGGVRASGRTGAAGLCPRGPERLHHHQRGRRGVRELSLVGQEPDRLARNDQLRLRHDGAGCPLSRPVGELHAAQAHLGREQPQLQPLHRSRAHADLGRLFLRRPSADRAGKKFVERVRPDPTGAERCCRCLHRHHHRHVPVLSSGGAPSVNTVTTIVASEPSGTKTRTSPSTLLPLLEKDDLGRVGPSTEMEGARPP